MDKKIREGRWDCSSCGHQGILGHEKNCPNCGNPKDPSEKFYLPTDAAEVSDQKLLQKAAIGPDWHCSFCGSANPGDRTTCVKCGAGLEDSNFNQVKDYQAPATGPGAAPRLAPPQPPTPPSPPSVMGRALASRAKLGALAAVVLLVLVFGGYLCFHTSDVPVTLIGFSWERSIDVEELRALTEDGFTPPADARIKSREQKLHHYNEKKIKTGTETKEYVCGQIDKGNGFFEDKMCTKTEDVYETEKEPVKQTFYRYEVDRWSLDHTEKASGNDQNPKWPDSDVRHQQREGARKEKYVAFFKDGKGKKHELDLDQSRWINLKLNQTYTGKVSALGSLREIE